MKTFKLLAWVAGISGGLLILLALVTLIFEVQLFGVGKAVNYFHAANSLLLASLLCLIAHNRCDCECECCKKEAQ